MYRHTSRKDGIEPISDKRFRELIAPLEKQGISIQRGDGHVEEHLKAMDAEAATFGKELIWFRKDVSLSGVLEELYHIEQNKRGLNDDVKSDLRTILNEIDAKKHLLEIAKSYQIPRLETELTKRQLKWYQEMLENYGKGGNFNV